MSLFNKIYGRGKRVEAGSCESNRTEFSDLPLDHQLTFDREAGEKWSFKDGNICLNDEEIEGLLDEERNNVSFQSGVSDALSEYKEVVREKGNGHFKKFSLQAEALQGKILSNMKRIYDECTGGVKLSWGDGVALLNKVNVRAVLAMYHIRPTQKARCFLKGLKEKLALILVNKNGNPQFERINGVVRELCKEVDLALNETPIDGAYLPINNGDTSA